MQRITAWNSGIDPVMVRDEILRVDHECVALPSSDGFAVEARHRDVRVGVRPSIQVNDAQAVHEFADHVDRCGQLNHGDGPHARHDNGQADRTAVADVVAVHLSFRMSFWSRIIVRLRLRRWIYRTVTYVDM